jgi:hypothetical protein
MFELTEAALKVLIDKFVEEIKKQIAAKQYPYGNPEKGLGDKIATGQLYDSIQGDVEMGPHGPIAVLSYADYFKNVNLGRRKGVGKVPLSQLLAWIKVRGIKGRNKKGQFMKNTSLAFAMQTNIFKYGIRPTNIYDRGLDGIEDMFNNYPHNLPQELREVGEHLFDAMANDINVFIDQSITKELESISTTEFLNYVK